MLSQIQAVLTQMQTASPSAAIAPAASHGAAGALPSFTHYMGDAIRSVDQQGQRAQDAVLAVETGRSDDLVSAMLKSQEASLSFQMMMQVRNKVVAAVDDLVKLPL